MIELINNLEKHINKRREFEVYRSFAEKNFYKGIALKRTELEKHYYEKKLSVVMKYEQELKNLDKTYMCSTNDLDYNYVYYPGLEEYFNHCSEEECESNYYRFIDLLIRRDSGELTQEIGQIFLFLEDEEIFIKDDRQAFCLLLNHFDKKYRTEKDSLVLLKRLYELLEKRKQEIKAITDEEYKILWGCELEKSKGIYDSLLNSEDSLEDEEKAILQSVGQNYYLIQAIQIIIHDLNENDQNEFIALCKYRNVKSHNDIMDAFIETAKYYDIGLINEYLDKMN